MSSGLSMWFYHAETQRRGDFVCRGCVVFFGLTTGGLRKYKNPVDLLRVSASLRENLHVHGPLATRFGGWLRRERCRRWWRG